MTRHMSREKMLHIAHLLLPLLPNRSRRCAGQSEAEFKGLLKMWLAMEIEDFPNWFEWQQSCFELIQLCRNAGVRLSAASRGLPRGLTC